MEKTCSLTQPNTIRLPPAHLQGAAAPESPRSHLLVSATPGDWRRAPGAGAAALRAGQTRGDKREEMSLRPAVEKFIKRRRLVADSLRLLRSSLRRTESDQTARWLTHCEALTAPVLQTPRAAAEQPAQTLPEHG